MADLFQASLYEVFRTKLFLIPDYQRGYAWEKKQVDDLIEDLELLPPGREHFFGTLVIRATGQELYDKEDNKFKVYEIIDGQQRLTTGIIFLSVIFQEMLKNSDRFKSQAEGIRKNFLGFLDKNECSQPKLILNQDCRTYFETSILGFDTDQLTNNPKIRSHQLIQNSRVMFRDFLRKLRDQSEDEYLNRLEILYKKIRDGLQLVVYEVDEEINAAGLIFERMNDRGKPLTELELVKNYILYMASQLVLPTVNNLRDEINHTWSTVFKNLMQIPGNSDSDEDALLRYHWIMSYSGNTKTVESRSIKVAYNLRNFPSQHHQELYHLLREYLITLSKSAVAYRDIRYPSHSDAFLDASPKWRPVIVELSQELVRLNALATFQPLLISVRLRETDGGETYSRILDLCEKFAFRVYAWNGSPARTGQSTIYWITREYYQKRLNREQVIKRLTDIILERCPELEFQKDFDEPENWYDWSAIRYFLYEYEQERVNQNGLPLRVSWEDLEKASKENTIEHILPQNPRPTYWKDRFTDEARERWKHDIGNLTLTYFNGELSDLSFPEKRDGRPGHSNCYRKSLIAIEQEIADFPEWTVETIQIRRERIRQWAIKRWQVNKVATTSSSAIENQDLSTTAIQPITSKRAVWATSEQRNPETWLISLAEDKNWKDEFCLLIDAVRKVGLYPRMQNNWWVISVTPPQNKNYGLIWIGPDGYFHPASDRIEKQYGIPQAKTLLLLGEKRTIQPSEAPALAEAIVTLFALIQKR